MSSINTKPNSGIESKPFQKNTSNKNIFNFLKKKPSKILQFSFIALVLGIISLAAYSSLNNGRNVAFAANDPVISLALSQKSGTAPFDSGTCTTGGTSYTPGQDVCDADNVVRTLDTVEYTWTVSVTSDPANNVTVVQTLPSQMIWNSATLPVFCRTGAGFNPQSSYSGQTLTCNLGSFTAGTSTTTNYDQIFAKVKGDNLNSTNILTAPITANADSNVTAGTRTANSTSNTLSPLAISASPRYDLVVFTTNPSEYSIRNNPQGDVGIVVSGVASIKLQGKGVEMPQQPFSFNLGLEYLTPVSSGQTYSGAKLYDWDTNLLGCSGTVNTVGAADYPSKNLNCTQTAPGDTVSLIVNNQDLSGTNAPATIFANVVNFPNIDIFSQKVRFWIPKTDFDKLSGTNFQFRAVGSNFNPVSISGGSNNGTGIESNTLNNVGSVTTFGYNPANPLSGVYQLSDFGGPSGDLRISSGFQVYTLNELGRISVTLLSAGLFNTENALDLCTAIDPTIGRVAGDVALPADPQNIYADFSNSIIEYANVNGFPATSCDDIGTTWVTSPNISSIGGFDNVTRVRIKNINRLSPGIQTILNIPFRFNNSVPNLDVLVSPYQTIIKSATATAGNWQIVGQSREKIVVKMIPRVNFSILNDTPNNNTTTVLLNNPAGGSNTVKYSLKYGSFSQTSNTTDTTSISYRLRLPKGQIYLVGSSRQGVPTVMAAGQPAETSNLFEPSSIITNLDGTQDIQWDISNLPLNNPQSTYPNLTFKTVVSAFTPNGSILSNSVTTLSPDYFNSTVSPACGSGCSLPQSTITVQNLSSFAVEQVPNNPLIEKNKDLGFTLRYGNLDTLNPVASSTHINVFPFSAQTPPRSPATSFTGNLVFKGLVVAPNSASSDPAVVNTNDNITGGAGTVQYTKAVSSSSIASDPCDVSNNPAGSPVNTNPRCAGVDGSVIGTGSTIWCDASLDPATPSIKNYSILNNAGVYSGTNGANSSTCPTTLSEVTAFRLVTGSLPIASGSGGTIYEVKANFGTNGNTNSNIYTNLSQARAEGIATVATSNSAVTRVSSGSVSGNIFNDKDSNGIKDILATIPNPNFDPGLPTDPISNPETITNPESDFDLSGVSVELRYGTGNLDENNLPIAEGSLITTVTTDSTGNYTFPNISSGNYTVVVLQNGIPLSIQTTDKDFALDLAANPGSPNNTLLDNSTPITLTYTNGVGVNNISNANFGYNQYSRLTGKLYADTNNNGIQDDGSVNGNPAEPDFNSTTNLIPTGTSVVITSTTTPSITYTLTTATSSTVVSGFTTGSINNSGVGSSFGSFSQDLPVGEYTVTVLTANPKYIVSVSTQLGDAVGANPSTLTVSFGQTRSSGNDGLHLVQIQNTDIDSIACNPTTTNVDTTTDCTVTLVAGRNFNALSGSIDFRIGDGIAGQGGTVKTCSIPVTGNGGTGSDGTITVTTLTCTGITVGSNIGIFPASFKTSNDTTFITGSSPTNITVINTIQPSDIDSIVCQSPKVVNATTDCVVTLTANAVSSNRAFNNLTGSIALKISDGILLTCPNFASSTSPFNTLNCNAVSVGSLISSGNGYTVNYALNASTTTTDAPNTPSKSNYVVVNNTIQPSNLSSVVCDSPKLINQTTDCVVTLVSGNSFANLSGDIKIKINDGLETSCPAFSSSITPFNTLTCTVIPVGTLIGTFKPAYSLSSSAAIDTLSTDVVVSNPVDETILSNPSTTINCQTNQINSITTCTFTLPTNTTLASGLKLGIGDSTPAGTCIVTNATTEEVTCTGVPTGSLIGQQIIKVQIASAAVVDTTSTALVTDTPCSTTNPCAILDSSLTYNPTQALAKRYGASGSTNSDNLILTLKDTRLEQSGFTTTCSIKYKFRTDTSYRILTTNSTYNNTTGCTGNLLKANQLLFNVDFEITAITTNTTTNTTKNYLIYSNYDFKAGSIGVTSIGGSGL